MRRISIFLFTILLIALILPINSETGIGSFGNASADTCPAGVVIANSGISQSVGGASDHVTNYLRAKKFTVSVSQAMTVTALCVYATTVDSTNKNLRIGIYSDHSGTPSGGTLLLQSPEITLTTGWNSVSVANINLPAGTYWFTIIGNGAGTVTAVTTGSSSNYYAVASSYGSLPSTFPSGASTPGPTAAILSAEVIGSQQPPGPDFSISSTPMSQSVGGGATTTYTLTIQYGSTLPAGTQVNLAGASGCPPTPASCSIFPTSVTDTAGGAGSDTATLSVMTDITTSGVTPYSIAVTASSTSPPLSHQVTVQLTVNAPGTYPVVVHEGATQVVVTVTWSNPVPPMPSVYLQYSPGQYLAEASGAVYDRLTCSSSTSGCSTGTITNIHRVTFTLNTLSPGSTQTWTVLVSLSGSYTITVEVA